MNNYEIYCQDVKTFLAERSKRKKKFNLVVTSPPYNIGKEYEKKISMQDYIDWQESIIDLMVPHIDQNGSICWQVGNHVDNGQITPLDYIFHEIFIKHGFKMRNRIVWTYGHGLHRKKSFSGRYEVVMWYSKSDDYTFNLDSVRIPQKYPNKKSFAGPNKGKLSGNSLGKNPEDVWTNIPNVKSNHVEKTLHPCQFPVGLVERLVLALSNPTDIVFDPYMGVGSAGVAALVHDRKFLGVEIEKKYFKIADKRLIDSVNGNITYRSHQTPIFNPENKKNISISSETPKFQEDLFSNKETS
ncbi:site-specific DNA-methyltransferase [Gammaproteobacteria bacterium]|jgi:adenine-specific DNA-methyltransferase|nr:site-specific DNA-methyltransferase [Gammaproteobacteria bacterium]